MTRLTFPTCDFFPGFSWILNFSIIQFPNIGIHHSLRLGQALYSQISINNHLFPVIVVTFKNFTFNVTNVIGQSRGNIILLNLRKKNCAFNYQFQCAIFFLDIYYRFWPLYNWSHVYTFQICWPPTRLDWPQGDTGWPKYKVGNFSESRVS